MNPYEPPESQIAPSKDRPKTNLLLIWFLSVLGAGITLPLWGLRPLGPIATCAACLVGGGCMAKRLHEPGGGRVLMSIVYAVLIAISLIGVFFGVCMLTLAMH